MDDLKTLGQYDVAHLYPETLDKGEVYRSAQVVIYNGGLCVRLWLNADEYDDAVLALEAAGWHCTGKEKNLSRWRSTSDGLDQPLLIVKNCIYQSPGESPKESECQIKS
jgi:hypothetical protein